MSICGHFSIIGMVSSLHFSSNLGQVESMNLDNYWLVFLSNMAAQSPARWQLRTTEDGRGKRSSSVGVPCEEQQRSVVAVRGAETKEWCLLGYTRCINCNIKMSYA